MHARETRRRGERERERENGRERDSKAGSERRRESENGGEHEGLSILSDSPLGDRVAHEGLSLAAGVGLRGVEEVATGFERELH